MAARTHVVSTALFMLAAGVQSCQICDNVDDNKVPFMAGELCESRLHDDDFRNNSLFFPNCFKTCGELMQNCGDMEEGLFQLVYQDCCDDYSVECSYCPPGSSPQDPDQLAVMPTYSVTASCQALEIMYDIYADIDAKYLQSEHGCEPLEVDGCPCTASLNHLAPIDPSEELLMDDLAVALGSSSGEPSAFPSDEPTAQPSMSLEPHSFRPSSVPSREPTVLPSAKPSSTPTLRPSMPPSSFPTLGPSGAPTNNPVSATPSLRPSPIPSSRPSAPPTLAQMLESLRPTQALEEFSLVQYPRIPGAELGSFFGSSVSHSSNGQVVAVGSPEAMERKGQVSVIVRSTKSLSGWRTIAVLNGENEDDTFGFDVSLSHDGSLLAVGAPGGNGSVYTFVHNATLNTFVPLGPPMHDNDSKGAFGHSVALSGDGLHLVAGAPYKSVGVLLNGHVRAYALEGGVWIKKGQHLNGDNLADWLGSAVDISRDGNVIAASAPRSRTNMGYVRSWAWNGTDWIQLGGDILNTLEPMYSTDRFGHSLALSEDPQGRRPRLAIGSPWKKVGDHRGAGAVFVYELDEGEWMPMAQPILQVPVQPFVEFGYAIDLQGDILSVGIPGFDSSRGAVELYQFREGQWRLRSQVLVGNAGDNFGAALSLHRERATDTFSLVVGAFMHGNGGAGYAALFAKEAI